MKKELLWRAFVHNKIESEQVCLTRMNRMTSPCFIKLDGELGSGKTAFAKYIAKSYGVSDLTSVSYLKYSLHRGYKNIIHIDFYNLSEPEQFFYDHIEEQIDDQSIVLSEWTPDGLKLDIAQFMLSITTKRISERMVSFLRIW